MSKDEPPLDRRQARARREAMADSEENGRGRPTFPDGFETSTPSVEMPTPSRTRRSKQLAIWAVIIITSLSVLVGGVIGAKRLYDQAMNVRAHLELSMTEVAEVKRAVLAGEADQASAAAARLGADTQAAVSGTSGRLWSFAEALPFVGPNLQSVRKVAEVTDQLASNVVEPASSLSLAALMPKGGAVDLTALTDLAEVIDAMAIGLDEAADVLEPIDRESLFPPVASGVEQLDDALNDVRSVVNPLRDISSVLPDALGASGARQYLVMFQGSSEARSLGGNAAVFIVIRADGGRLEITNVVNSSDFPQGLPEPVAELDPEAVGIFGDKIGRFTPDFTMVPDYPEAASILQDWWKQVDSTTFDGVMSLDPVALSYLLSATGPIELPTGDTLDASNATALLLNEVYFRYDDIFEQNAFFEATTTAVFSAIMSGSMDVIPFITALGRAAGEGRLLYASADPAQSDLIGNQRFSGIMASDGPEQTTVGVYINDNTSSKKSYYLDLAVDVCTSGTSLETGITLSSTLTAEEAARLPAYITGPYFQPSDISTYVAVYGPTGSSLGATTTDGAPAKMISRGTHLGRPVALVEIVNHLADAHTLSVTFDGVEPSYGPVDVWRTPMTRETTATVTPACK